MNNFLHCFLFEVATLGGWGVGAPVLGRREGGIEGADLGGEEGCFEGGDGVEHGVVCF